MNATTHDSAAPAPLLALRGITKRFPGVAALEDVRLSVRAGEIHALCGENGAGKSTLMKVVSGVYPHPDHGGDYGGELCFDGEVRRFAGIADSERLGIIIIHQELALVPQLSIAENLFLGHEPARLGVIDRMAMHQRAVELLARVGLRASPQTPVGELGVGQQQLVEIAKALAKEVRLLILDEPTASLNDTDSDALLDLLLELKRQGIASILISHKLKEVTRVADGLTVLRDGRSILSLDCATDPISEARIIQAMVGRDLSERYPPRTPAIGELLFELRDWRAFHPVQAGREVVKGVDLTVRRGEIVGIAGLMGAGRTELAMSVFGRSYGRRISGSAWMDGREVDVSTVPKAIAAGLAYVTEDRKSLGLLLEESVAVNTSLAHLGGVSRGGVLDRAREHQVAQDFRRQLGTRCAGVDQRVVHLSGGNQQKVVLAKWLFAGPRLLILDEPTRGIDVGAKYEIYSLIAGLAARGCGILLISSEMPELLGLCDRLYVMNEGRMVAEFPAAGTTQEMIMGAIVGAGEVAHV
ncbi:multiple monosaccharide ABC transporter ATP-binding protein [Mitsuaria sp. PDC51]|uniref:sugar ABC transporter ATP-binding protein n=1 Tax=unclassified Roseateles TaxID=2626991 RepID=UPI0008EDA8C0|nr:MULTISPECIES: sugar ABC transporter ATP-binding protein [unclassified Roseateles]MBB3284927.1 putative multiple sugar transport system ATP-binding protein [Mitsuaria sp. BK037]MBB3292091.1 putative multiple sugar transport system ATP-binding protein [Mitsuaria sp. BK041]MBB3361308.1 putative multiple sugar transport system ATP-binding protein [Mitsuaria sp. BK045]SFR73110.1 multiple monosaccharide ABC transporter ATP-binding protein [Mitsuaria sp. PDC51]